MVVGDNGALNEYNTLNWLCDDCLLENDLERVSYTIRFSTDILIMLYLVTIIKGLIAACLCQNQIYVLYNVHS